MMRKSSCAVSGTATMMPLSVSMRAAFSINAPRVPGTPSHRHRPDACVCRPSSCTHSAWCSGQDQAKSIQLLLEQLLPNVKVFVDVDTALRRDAEKDRKSRRDTKRNRQSGRDAESSRRGEESAEEGAVEKKDMDWMQKGVCCSSVLVALLTGGPDKDNEETISDYFNSKNCMNEINTAVEKKKRIVLLVETDKDHGGVSMSVHRKTCEQLGVNRAVLRWKKALRAVLRWTQDEQLGRPGDVQHGHLASSSDEHEHTHESAQGSEENKERLDAEEEAEREEAEQEEAERKEAEREEAKRSRLAALEVFECLFKSQKHSEWCKDNVVLIPWFRYAELQEVSIRLVAQAILQAEARENSDEAKGKIYVRGDLQQQCWQLRTPHDSYHLFVSEHNEGAEDFIKWLKVTIEKNKRFKGPHYVEELRVTNKIDELDMADFFLLYLNTETWRKDIEKGKRLCSHIKKAQKQMPHQFCIVHEMREEMREGEDTLGKKCYGAINFLEIYHTCPSAVRKGPLANNMALPMTNGIPGCTSTEHELACISVLLRRICPQRPFADFMRAVMPNTYLTVHYYLAQRGSAGNRIKAGPSGNVQKSVAQRSHHRLSVFERPAQRLSVWASKSGKRSRAPSRKGSLLPTPATSRKGSLLPGSLVRGTPPGPMISPRASLIQAGPSQGSSDAPDFTEVAIEPFEMESAGGNGEASRQMRHARGKRVSYAVTQ